MKCPICNATWMQTKNELERHLGDFHEIEEFISYILDNVEDV